jgi:ethanolamine utilization protein EutQ (cupin superfamily)
VYVLEGSVALKDCAGGSRRVGAGETIFFPAGSRAEWTVDTYIRKIAFLRVPLPLPLSWARRNLRQLKHWVCGTVKTDQPATFNGG